MFVSDQPKVGLSYRNIPNVLSAAEITGVDAIHPGYGFLAENAHFAEVCESIGITFIGPSSEHIALLSDKSRARAHMKKHGIPVLPGSDGEIEDPKVCLAIAKKLGFPVIVKASAGGGGRGMRVVWHEEDLEQAVESAQLEAHTALGMEACTSNVFLKILGILNFKLWLTRRGKLSIFMNVIVLFSVGTKKLLKSPIASLDAALRRKMGQVAVEVMKSVKYRNAGTVEFLMDETGKFYFMEVNTRIQVEHPVTEMVTGADLIKEQIRIAAGQALSYRQKDIQLLGHAIECRVNAEDPVRLTPCPGTVTKFCVPGGPGIRVDTAMDTTGVVSPYYDSMIAKLIGFGRDRSEALARMQRALDEFVVEGIQSNIPLHRRILDHPDFQKGPITTRFLDRLLTLQSV